MTKQLDLFYDYLGMPREPSIDQLAIQMEAYKEALLAKQLQEKPYYERIQCCG